MNMIILMAAGILLVIWPEEYTTYLIDSLGAVLLIIAVILTLDFVSSKRTVANFAFFTIALILAITGMLVLVNDTDTLYVLGYVFGAFLIVDGLHGILHALVFARRSQRKGWWVMLPLSICLIVFGWLVFFHPYWSTPTELMKVIGWVLLFSAVLYGLRLIWVWPIKSE
ncbi:MAG: DUF308 domain-containing protein [Blautia sp.]|nr:DUF308 domain-containing protein [Blautia sp.]MBR2561856.1 DUF308 domain-containing protein [Eubacterium sp.]